MEKKLNTMSGFRCVRAVPIEAGMSSDEKYDVMLEDGRRCLMRISHNSQLERKKKEYEMLQTAFRHGIPVPEPCVFGRYDESSIFQLIRWIDGQTLEAKMPELSEAERFDWGEQAGALLKRIHSVPAPLPEEDWKARFRRKIEIRLAEAGELINGTECIHRVCRYLMEKIDILDGCRQCFNHGDFYPGNLIHGKDGKLAAIDFNAYNGGCGDPFFETASTLLDRKTDEQFKQGFRKGYYGTQKERYPEEILEYYRAYMLLAELCETEDETEMEDILEQMRILTEERQTE